MACHAKGRQPNCFTLILPGRMAGTAPLPTRDVSANALWFPGAYLCTARRFRPFRLTFRAVDSRLVRLRPRTASKSCLSWVALLPLFYRSVRRSFPRLVDF